MRAIFCAAAAALIAISGTTHAALIIDTFDQSAAGRVVSASTAASDIEDGLPMDHVLGGSRMIEVVRTSGAGLLKARVNDLQPGLAALNSFTGVSGDFAFAYGSSAGRPDLNANFSGDDRFSLTVVDADFGGTLALSVTSGATTETVSVPFASGPSLLEVPFAMFSIVTFSDVDGVKFTIKGPDSFDARIDMLGTVPEPAALIMAAPLLLLSRRRTRC